MPLSTHQLDGEQLTQLNALAKRCQNHDGNAIPIYTNQLLQRRNLPCNLLYYHQRQLIGFLSVFFFYDDACELTLMVDPAWRKQCIAARLMSTILPVLTSRELDHLFFLSPHGLNDAWLTSRGLSYHHSELQMQWKKGRAVTLNHPELSFCQSISDNDISTLVTIDMACFDTEKNILEDRFYRLLRDDTYQLFMIKLNNQPIGKAHLHRESGQAQLSDVAILPDYQGRGFGKELVAHCVQSAPQTLPLRLCVELTNQTALNLYQKIGFKTINTWDFWVLPMTKLLNCVSDNN